MAELSWAAAFVNICIVLLSSMLTVAKACACLSAFQYAWGKSHSMPTRFIMFFKRLLWLLLDISSRSTNGNCYFVHDSDIREKKRTNLWQKIFAFGLETLGWILLREHSLRPVLGGIHCRVGSVQNKFDWLLEIIQERGIIQQMRANPMELWTQSRPLVKVLEGGKCITIHLGSFA